MSIHRRSTTLPALGLALLTALAPQARQAPQPTAQDTSWRASLAAHDRRWIGPEFFANRLADWRLANGRIECVEADPKLPARTLQLLTRALTPEPLAFRTSVHTAAIDSAGSADPQAWTGFLIGSGGQHVDYRLSAMTHLLPGEDGGLLAVLDGAGRLVLRDFSGSARQQGTWALNGPLQLALVPELAVSEAALDPTRLSQGVELVLEGHPEGERYVLSLTALAPGSGQELGRVSYTAATDELAAHVDGALALTSHLGPRGSGTGYWFSDWQVSGPKLARHDERTFGPVLATQYTLSRGTLKLSAQFAPIGEQDAREARLEVRAPAAASDSWTTIATSPIDPDAYTATFRVESWDASVPTDYRVSYALSGAAPEPLSTHYRGTIRAEPARDEPFVIAALTGHKCYTGGLRWNHDGLWFPHGDILAALEAHDPDLLFFSGDQVYEGDLTPPVREPEEAARLDYLYKWSRFCWAFGGLSSSRPTITIPDDHDVYQGNIWGAGNQRAEPDQRFKNDQDRGGYGMPARFVNMVHRTQTSHLPDPVLGDPLPGGISVYTTAVEYAGISFAVLADRMWKSAPAVVVPDGRVSNGWFLNRGFDPLDADVEGAVLLGERQQAFLESWAADWSQGTWMKVVLSQTIFANLATLPVTVRSGAQLPALPIWAKDTYPGDHLPAADADSNGWPQTPRNDALRAMRRAFAFHIAGDQHLASTLQYGIDAWRDAGFAVCVPSIANAWPRRWFPAERGLNTAEDAARNTGDYLDGFGNRMSVEAVANPFRTGHQPAALHDRGPGYGIVELLPGERRVRIACWPRWASPADPGAAPYEGWPVEFDQLDNHGPPTAWLPELSVEGLEQPVVQLVRTDDPAITGEQIVYTLRLPGPSWRPPVYAEGRYKLRVGDPPEVAWQTLEDLRPTTDEEAATLRLEF